MMVERPLRKGKRIFSRSVVAMGDNDMYIGERYSWLGGGLASVLFSDAALYRLPLSSPECKSILRHGGAL